MTNKWAIELTIHGILEFDRLGRWLSEDIESLGGGLDDMPRYSPSTARWTYKGDA